MMCRGIMTYGQLTFVNFFSQKVEARSISFSAKLLESNPAFLTKLRKFAEILEAADLQKIECAWEKRYAPLL